MAGSKPSWKSHSTPEEIVTDLINAGCYVFKRSVIEQIPAGRVVSVERETFPGLLAAGANVRGVVDEGYWLDLGTPLAFVQGSKDLVTGKAPSPAVSLTGEALALDGAVIDGSAEVSGGSVIGRGAAIGAGAVVEGSVVFDEAVIGGGSRVVDSIVGAGARIGENCDLHGVVVGDGAVIGAGNELRDGARVWPNVELSDVAIRYSTDS